MNMYNFTKIILCDVKIWIRRQVAKGHQGYQHVDIGEEPRAVGGQGRV